MLVMDLYLYKLYLFVFKHSKPFAFKRLHIEHFIVHISQKAVKFRMFQFLCCIRV